MDDVRQGSGIDIASKSDMETGCKKKEQRDTTTASVVQELDPWTMSADLDSWPERRSDDLITEHFAVDTPVRLRDLHSLRGGDDVAAVTTPMHANTSLESESDAKISTATASPLEDSTGLWEAASTQSSMTASSATEDDMHSPTPSLHGFSTDNSADEVDVENEEEQSTRETSSPLDRYTQDHFWDNILLLCPVGSPPLGILSTPLFLRPTSQSARTDDESPCSEASPFPFSPTKSLSFNGRGLVSVPKSIFQVVMLSELDLSYNKLKEIPPQFERLGLLKKLLLQGNELQCSPLESYSKFGFLSKLKHLLYLDVSLNRLKCLPQQVTSLSQLEYLNASHNELVELPSNFRRLSALRSLHLEHNRLTHIPADLGELSFLRFLTAFDNVISSLHPNLHFPPSLVHLDLSANQIEILHPAHFSRANFVRILHLSDNQLFDIEEEMFIGQLRRLEQLHVCGNELVALPESIGRRRWLKVLNIARNKITCLPRSIDSLSRLVKLHASHNSLSGCLVRQFGMLRSLITCDLSFNCINQLPWTVAYLKKVQHLNLRHNQLTLLPSELCDMKSLRFLDVSNNPTLQAPPLEVCESGMLAVLAYLRKLPPSDDRLLEDWELVNSGEEDEHADDCDDDDEDDMEMMVDDFGLSKRTVANDEHSFIDEAHIARVRGWGGNIVGEEAIRRQGEEKARREEEFARRQQALKSEKVKATEDEQSSGSGDGLAEASQDPSSTVSCSVDPEDRERDRDGDRDGWVGWMGSMIVSAVTFGLVSPRSRKLHQNSPHKSIELRSDALRSDATQGEAESAEGKTDADPPVEQLPSKLIPRPPSISFDDMSPLAASPPHATHSGDGNSPKAPDNSGYHFEHIANYRIDQPEFPEEEPSEDVTYW